MIYLDVKTRLRSVPAFGGISRYVGMLIDSNRRNQIQFRGYAVTDKRDSIDGLDNDQVEWITMPYNKLRVMGAFVYQYIKRQDFGEGSLVHSTSGIPIPHNGVSLCTIHDLAHEEMPEVVDPHTRRYYKKWLSYNIQRKAVDHYIVPAPHVQSELLNRFYPAVQPYQISVVPHVVEDSWTYKPPSHMVGRVLDKWRLTQEQYIFVPGAMHKRKNAAMVISALEKMRSSLVLVLGGQSGWGAPELVNRAKRAQIDIKLVGYVSDDEQKCLYVGARGAIFPSVYEGYDIGVDEASALEVPTLMSDIPPHRLRAGTSILFSPRRLGQLCEALAEIEHAGPAERGNTKSGFDHSMKSIYEHLSACSRNRGSVTVPT